MANIKTKITKAERIGQKNRKRDSATHVTKVTSLRAEIADEIVQKGIMVSGDLNPSPPEIARLLSDFPEEFKVIVDQLQDGA